MYKMDSEEAPPSTVKTGGAQKEATPTEAENRDKVGQKKPAGQAQEFGYIVTNQRYSSFPPCLLSSSG